MSSNGKTNGPLRVGIGGPVGAGKTTLTEMLCKAMRDRYSVAVVTNDIYTKEDALILNRVQALPEERILGVETGGCPHTAIREDASINLQAIAEMRKRFPDLDVIFIESGGDNLAATFSPELADITIYVIDVAGGEKVPRKGGPGITRSDLLVVNKIDLAPYVGADLDVMESDTQEDARRASLCLRRHASPQGPGPASSHSSRRPAAFPPEEYAEPSGAYVRSALGARTSQAARSRFASRSSGTVSIRTRIAGQLRK